MPNNKAALYIHWPYCLSRCPYCDFNSHISANIDHAAWKKAYIQEINYFYNLVPDKTITSIYLGGGTPSLMPPSLVESILNHIHKKWTCIKNLEITLEANPTSVEYSKFQELSQAGVNRASIGVQSLDKKSLTFLGRNHAPDDAIQAISIAQKHFARYSFDLIYARPTQTLKAWKRELTQALTYAQDHISLYQLTIEPGTVFHTQHQRGEFILPDDSLADDLYDLTDAMLEARNLSAYEISNFAAPDQESRHNMHYWRYNDYIGIGPGAHGRLTIKGEKYAQRHHRAPAIWLQRVATHKTGLQQQTRLTPDIRFQEMILMGLRIREGIPYAKITSETGYDFWNKVGVHHKKELELSQDLVPHQERLILTKKGRKRINTIVSYLNI